MTPEQRRQYMREYRAEGFGKYADKEYRKRHGDLIRAKDRERKRLMRMLKNKPRRDDGVCFRT